MTFQSDIDKQVAEDRNTICGLPIVPVRQIDANIDPNREFLIRYIEKKWVNHTVLHYHFLEAPEAWQGSDPQKQAVGESFKAWKGLGLGLEFEEVNSPNDAEIRIGFERGGSWSYVGRDAIDLVPNSNDRTMNFGWDLTTTYGRDTASHEIGHALGFPHEHQNPNAGIVWDEEAVYSSFGGPPNHWSRDKTHYNVIRKISSTAVGGSSWDKDSIMHYQFSSGLILLPREYRTRPLIPADGLSATDREEALKFYPGDAEEEMPELEPYLSRLVDIDPGQQLNFVINPPVSRSYTIQTFGELDTVIVLFEEVNGRPVYVAGDDDSGTNFNARIEIRLMRGRTYNLRLRLYYADVTGQGAVMVW